MSHVSLGRPEFVPGTPPGHPTAKFLYVIFLYRFFSLHKYGWDFPEEKFQKDPGNALRAFPGIPLKSTAGMPQAL